MLFFLVAVLQDLLERVVSVFAQDHQAAMFPLIEYTGTWYTVHSLTLISITEFVLDIDSVILNRKRNFHQQLPIE